MKKQEIMKQESRHVPDESQYPLIKHTSEDPTSTRCKPIKLAPQLSTYVVPQLEKEEAASS